MALKPFVKAAASAVGKANKPAQKTAQKTTRKNVDAQDVDYRDMSTKEYTARTKAQDTKTGRKIAAGVAGATAVGIGASMMAGGDKKSTATAKEAPARIAEKQFLEMEAKDTGSRRRLTGFEKEFANARAAGKKTFTFDGKSYTTRRAEEDQDTFLKNLSKIKEKNQSKMDKKIEEVSKMSRGGKVTRKATKK
jgi:hypothetical protein